MMASVILVYCTSVSKRSVLELGELSGLVVHWATVSVQEYWFDYMGHAVVHLA